MVERAGSASRCSVGRIARTSRSERGAALVEAAVALPLLLSVLFGIIDFGSVSNDWISVRQGARDGLRQAIVNTRPAGPNGGVWGCPIVATTAPVVGSDAERLVCFTKDRVGLDQNMTRVKILFAAPYKAGQPVKICVQYTASSLTGFYSPLLNNKVLNTQAESLIEQDQASFVSPFEETSLTGWPASCNTL